MKQLRDDCINCEKIRDLYHLKYKFTEALSNSSFVIELHSCHSDKIKALKILNISKQRLLDKINSITFG